METVGDDLITEKGNISGSKYFCAKCDYKCSDLCSWDKHLLTASHNSVTVGDAKGAITGQKGQTILSPNSKKLIRTTSVRKIII